MSGKRVLFLGDIVGEPGRAAVTSTLPVADRAPPARPGDRQRRERRRRPRHHAAHRGQAVRRRHRRAHHRQPRLPAPRRLRASRHAATAIVRPANYLETNPGRGHTVVEKDGVRWGVVNLSGNVFMQAAHSPFHVADRMLAQLARRGRLRVRRLPRRGDEREGRDGLAPRRPRARGASARTRTCRPPTAACCPAARRSSPTSA